MSVNVDVCAIYVADTQADYDGLVALIQEDSFRSVAYDEPNLTIKACIDTDTFEV